MPQPAPPNYRQQRAIDRAMADLAIAIMGHAPDSDTVHQALRTLVALTDSVKAVVRSEESRSLPRPFRHLALSGVPVMQDID